MLLSSTRPNITCFSICYKTGCFLLRREYLVKMGLLLTWKANCPEKSYMPQECIRLRVFLTASGLSTRSPVIGQVPPFAKVAAMTLALSLVTSMEHSWRFTQRTMVVMAGHGRADRKNHVSTLFSHFGFFLRLFSSFMIYLSRSGYSL